MQKCKPSVDVPPTLPIDGAVRSVAREFKLMREDLEMVAMLE